MAKRLGNTMKNFLIKTLHKLLTYLENEKHEKQSIETSDKVVFISPITNEDIYKESETLTDYLNNLQNKK